MASIAFHIMVRLARWRRTRFAANLANWATPVDRPMSEVPATLLAFCGRRDLPEQVASWRSFQRWVGRPRRAVLVSDGTLEEGDFKLLRALEPRLEIKSLEEFGGATTTEAMRSYATQQPMGRKLWVMRAMDSLAPVIYADSDILYFPAAAELSGPRFWEPTTPSYLLDPYPSLDLRMILGESERLEPVNGGFVVVRQALEWAEPMHRLESLTGEAAFFSEQTLLHLAIRRSGGCPLNPTRYALRNEDQWAATDWFAGPEVALRHYISSLRHKMWLRVRASGSATTNRNPIGR
jgi:hypothetical protein